MSEQSNNPPAKEAAAQNRAADPSRLALAAAQLGEALVAAVRAGRPDAVGQLLWPGSAAWWSLKIFGLALLRFDLRLDDPREGGQLLPYDLQIEPEAALLELGVVRPLAVSEAAEARAEGRSHLIRLFGSSLLLKPAVQAPYGWLVEEVLPVNSDGQLRPTDPADELILRVHQGQLALPLNQVALDPTERLFLTGIQNQPGRFNVEELFNAARLWQDFREIEPEAALQTEAAGQWAAAVEYLITLFDYHSVELESLSERYNLAGAGESVTDRAREIAAALRVTQFDDRYTIHPDPIAHYRQLFGELGIDPRRDEEMRRASLDSRIFDSIEVAPDDEDFFGPR